MNVYAGSQYTEPTFYQTVLMLKKNSYNLWSR